MRCVVSSIIRGWCGHLTINRTFGSSCHRGSLTLRNGVSASHLAFFLLLWTSGANRGTSLLQAALQLGFRQSRGSAKDASTWDCALRLTGAWHKKGCHRHRSGNTSTFKGSTGRERDQTINHSAVRYRYNHRLGAAPGSIGTELLRTPWQQQ